MQGVKPIQVALRNVPPSPGLAALVERRAEHLMMHRPPILSVRVAVEVPHRRHRKGTPVRVNVELGVPGRTLVARARHPDTHAAILRAFDAAERRLRAYRGRRRSIRQRVWLPWERAPEPS